MGRKESILSRSSHQSVRTQLPVRIYPGDNEGSKYECRADGNFEGCITFFMADRVPLCAIVGRVIGSDPLTLK